MNKKVTKILLIVIVILGISMTIYGYLNKHRIAKVSKERYTENNKKTFNKNTDTLSAWIAYWDLNVNDEIKSLGKRLKEVSYFEVYFDLNNKPTMQEDLLEYYNKTKNNDYIKYLSIANDKINSDKTYSLKDTDLLKSLLIDSELRSNHIKEIINLASEYDFDGIEIDYEQIKNDMDLWNSYVLFIDELYNKCNESKLKLRIVLEPNTPIENLNFIEGPTYVMMCYNLHSSSSKPGEKANPKFIEELINKMEKVPGTKNFALATGGFDWGSNGNVKSISQVEAKSLAKTYNVKEERDSESQCLVFRYSDEKNVNHEVWYADTYTLNTWMNVIDRRGYNISIWRLGGNLFD